MKALYLHNRLFWCLGILGVMFILAYIFPNFFVVPKFLLFGVMALLVIDLFLLFRNKKSLDGRRLTPEKLSNGDENPLSIYLENRYPFEVKVRVIDEVPFQFQVRDTDYHVKVGSGKTKVVNYSLRPTKRGEYHFGAVNAFVQTPIGLASRRFQFGKDHKVPVYPSYLQMRKYELLAISNRINEYGIKKIRRIGQSMEFEQIRQYVQGDDYRNVNWKATARKNQLMVNQFQDEKSQRVYSVIDKGRVMKSPFNGMTLLDYAINAALVISNIALRKEDKPGLVTFEAKLDTLLKAEKVGSQMRKIQEALYNQQTSFRESNYAKLYGLFSTKFQTRSLVLLYTNFETLSGLKRQLPFLRKIAKSHVVVVIFFKNTELEIYAQKISSDLNKVYDKIIAEKMALEKRQIVKELGRYGIQSILTSPADLTVNTINKYLELKARGMI